MPICSSHQKLTLSSKNYKSVAVFGPKTSKGKICAFQAVLPPGEFHTDSLALKAKEGQQILLQNHNLSQY